MPTKLNHDIIAAAIEGFEAQKARIDLQIAELKAVVSGSPIEPVAEAAAKPQKRKRRLSPEGRKAIADAARKRWAAVNAAKAASASPKKAAKKKSAAKTVAKKAAVTAAPAKAAKKAAPAKKAAVKKPASTPEPAAPSTK
jgi:hypothetical protein